MWKKKFVAIQQNSATLIYDFNTMKGTMEGYLKLLKKNNTANQNSTVPTLKITPSSKSFKKTENCFEPP